jgi:hypothetical protein
VGPCSPDSKLGLARTKLRPYPVEEIYRIREVSVMLYPIGPVVEHS